MSRIDRVRAWAPASVSNLGPGFDALGAALSGLGDTVVVERTKGAEVEVVWHDASLWTGPKEAHGNTAAVAALSVATQAGYTRGLKLTIRKGWGAGTGLGSSAASAVAAAVATEKLLEAGLDAHAMLQAVIAGEAVASGAGHGDNVLPSLLGGFVLMRSRSPEDLVRIPSWPTLRVVILLPEMSILTRNARSVLPETVRLGEAVDHAARLALLVDALHRRDTRALGRWMMSDTIVEPARAALLPHLSALRSAALDAGALGCTVSGSGPAIMAVCDADTEAGSDSLAEGVRQALMTAARAHGWHVTADVHQICNHGARIEAEKGAISWREKLPCPWPEASAHE